jgi:hypothetical protein
MTDRTYAGYTLTSRRPAPSAAVELWLAEGPEGAADVYLGPEMLAQRARVLPRWGPFPAVLTGNRDGRWFVLVPGSIETNCNALSQQLTPPAALAVAFHITAAVSEVHARGGAHGALHARSVGLDDEGKLTIRPALAMSVLGEPDPAATAQATDCLQLCTLFEALGLEALEDPAVPLLLTGLKRERARLRIQPGRAVRQSLAALLARYPEAEASVIHALGPSWATHMTPRAPLQDVDRPRVNPWAPAGPTAPPSASAFAPAKVNLGGVVQSRPGPAVAAAAESERDAHTTPTMITDDWDESVEDPVTPTAALSVSFRPAVAAVAAVATPIKPARINAGAGSSEDSDPESAAAASVPAVAFVSAEEAALSEPTQITEVAVDLAQLAMPATAPTSTPSPKLASTDLASSDLASTDLASTDLASPDADATPAEPSVSSVQATPVQDDDGLWPAPPTVEPLLAAPPTQADGEPQDGDTPDTEAQGGDAQDSEPPAQEEAAPASGPSPVSTPSPTTPDASGSASKAASETASTAAPSPSDAVPSAAQTTSAQNPGFPPPTRAPAEGHPSELPAAAETAPTLPPSDSREAASEDAPKWSGATGVTGSDSREHELGSGKWDESAQARSLEDLRKEMDTTPVRELELEPGGPRWGLIALAAIVVLVLVSWWFFGPAGDPSPEPRPEVAAQPEDNVREAAPLRAEVTITTTPTGARIRLDDRSYGRTPALVPVPTDDRIHRLCAEFEGAEPACRDITGAALASADPYEITLSE